MAMQSIAWIFVIITALSCSITVDGASLNDSMTQEIIKQCLNEHNLTKLDFDDTSAEIASIQERVECAAHCFFERSDLLDANGKLDIDKLSDDDDINEKQMATLLRCREENESVNDKCKYAFNMMTCFAKDVVLDDIKKAFEN